MLFIIIVSLLIISKGVIMNYVGYFLSTAAPYTAYAGQIISQPFHAFIPLMLGERIVSVFDSSLARCEQIEGTSVVIHRSSNPSRMIASIACFIFGEAASFWHSPQAGIYFTAGVLAGGVIKLASNPNGLCKMCKGEFIY